MRPGAHELSDKQDKFIKGSGFQFNEFHLILLKGRIKQRVKTIIVLLQPV